MSSRPAADRLLWTVVGISAALIVVTLVASQFAADPPGRMGRPPGARSLPRMARPPASTAELLRSLGVGSLIWYACFATAPLFVWMSRRLPFDRRRWTSSLVLHVLVIVVIALVTGWLQYRLNYRGSPFAPPLSAYLKVAMITGTLPFLTVAAGAHALEARARAHERELEAERIRSQLAESRLEALTAQLQPHFLFNTLQGISTLITRDPVAADHMLTNLSDLLREVLRRGDKREVELSEELRVLEPYLDISRRRFGDRLSVRVDVSPEASSALVPFFVLQPLVENALHHGISSHKGEGWVEIAARREHDRLHVAVTDSGAGTATLDASRGIGLTNTRARLRELYGDAQSLELARDADREAFRVSVTIPYRVRVDGRG